MLCRFLTQTGLKALVDQSELVASSRVRHGRRERAAGAAVARGIDQLLGQCGVVRCRTPAVGDTASHRRVRAVKVSVPEGIVWAAVRDQVNCARNVRRRFSVAGFVREHGVALAEEPRGLHRRVTLVVIDVAPRPRAVLSRAAVGAFTNVYVVRLAVPSVVGRVRRRGIGGGSRGGDEAIAFEYAGGDPPIAHVDARTSGTIVSGYGRGPRRCARRWWRGQM